MLDDEFYNSLSEEEKKYKFFYLGNIRNSIELVMFIKVYLDLLIGQINQKVCLFMRICLLLILLGIL